jgi:ABC-type dipeptide/oligopeptide/nickel transport system permease component
MIDTRGEDYVRTAIAKGLRARRVDFRHAMPPAVPTTVALAGAYAPVLVGNALLVEIVFNLPGVFRGFPDALDTNDFVLIQALIVVGALMVALANLAADLVLAGLDPRTRPWAARS